MRTAILLPAIVLAACAHASACPTSTSPSHSTPTRTSTPTSISLPSPPPPEVAAILQSIDPARLHADVARLAAFGTRHTLSDTTSDTRGIGAARRWIAAEITRAGGGTLHVVLEPHLVHADGKRIPWDVEVVDVVATLPGASPRRVYAVAHDDSRCTDVIDATCDAPGANDDASGVAVLLEPARVLAHRHRAPRQRPRAAAAVEAAGVHFIDVYVRSGAYARELPAGLGEEGAGGARLSSCRTAARARASRARDTRH